MDRVMIFIDGNNLYQGAKDLLGRAPRIDLQTFAHALCGPDRRLMRTYYYSALSDREDNPSAYSRHKSFLDEVNTLPRFEVVVGYLQKKAVPGKRIDTADSSTYIHTEKETDVNIATDMLSLAYDDGYDVAILVSADSDYTRVIDRIKSRGKVVEVAICEGARAYKLKHHADDVLTLNPDFFAVCSLPSSATAAAAAKLS